MWRRKLLSPRLSLPHGHLLAYHRTTEEAAEQWKKLIEDLLVLKDVVLIEESCPPEKKEDFA